MNIFWTKVARNEFFPTSTLVFSFSVDQMSEIFEEFIDAACYIIFCINATLIMILLSLILELIASLSSNASDSWNIPLVPLKSEFITTSDSLAPYQTLSTTSKYPSTIGTRSESKEPSSTNDHVLSSNSDNDSDKEKNNKRSRAKKK